MSLRCLSAFPACRPPWVPRPPSFLPAPSPPTLSLSRTQFPHHVTLSFTPNAFRCSLTSHDSNNHTLNPFSGLRFPCAFACSFFVAFVFCLSSRLLLLSSLCFSLRFVLRFSPFLHALHAFATILYWEFQIDHLVYCTKSHDGLEISNDISIYEECVSTFYIMSGLK